jgi:hypothetical protein
MAMHSGSGGDNDLSLTLEFTVIWRRFPGTVVRVRTAYRWGKTARRTPAAGGIVPSGSLSAASAQLKKVIRNRSCKVAGGGGSARRHGY